MRRAPATSRRWGLSEPTTSHHLKQLLGAGLVTKRRDGMNVYAGAQPKTPAISVMRPCTSANQAQLPRRSRVRMPASTRTFRW